MLRSLEALALSSVRTSGSLILCIHDVDRGTFVRWIRFVESHFKLVSLDELVDRLQSEKPLPGLVAITLDDGWNETCRSCAALADELHWPITIYVPTGVLDPPNTLWMAEWPGLLSGLKGKRVEANGYVLDAKQPQSVEDLKRQLIALPGREAVDVVLALKSAAGIKTSQQKPPFIDEEFIVSHAKSSWISFGSHSVDHQALANQTPDSIKRQFQDSKQRLSQLTGYTIRHFCYPYGDDANIGTEAPTLVSQYYESATTMNRGVVTSKSQASRLPRIPLYPGDFHLRVVAKFALAGRL